MKIDNCPLEVLEKMDITPLRTIQNNGCLEFEFKAMDRHIPFMIRQLVGSGINVHACSGKAVELDNVFERLVQLVQHAD